MTIPIRIHEKIVLDKDEVIEVIPEEEQQVQEEEQNQTNKDKITILIPGEITEKKKDLIDRLKEKITKLCVENPLEARFITVTFYLLPNFITAFLYLGLLNDSFDYWYRMIFTFPLFISMIRLFAIQFDAKRVVVYTNYFFEILSVLLFGIFINVQQNLIQGGFIRYYKQIYFFIIVSVFFINYAFKKNKFKAYNLIFVFLMLYFCLYYGMTEEIGLIVVLYYVSLGVNLLVTLMMYLMGQEELINMDICVHTLFSYAAILMNYVYKYNLENKINN